MAADRDAIFQALLARLTGLPGLKTVEDRMVHWSTVDAGAQPFLSVVKGEESNIGPSRGLPPKWTFGATLYLYCHAATRPDMSAQRQLNRLLTQIEGAFEHVEGEDVEAPPPFYTTLGGLVVRANILGPVATDEGTLGDQSVGIIPVEIIATG